MAINKRPSLETGLLSRYANQHCGGAFEVKDAVINGGHESLNKASPGSMQSVFWTPAGFKTRMAHMITELKAKALNFVDSQGLDNRKYKP